MKKEKVKKREEKLNKQNDDIIELVSECGICLKPVFFPERLVHKECTAKSREEILSGLVCKGHGRHKIKLEWHEQECISHELLDKIDKVNLDQLADALFLRIALLKEEFSALRQQYRTKQTQDNLTEQIKILKELDDLHEGYQGIIVEIWKNYIYWSNRLTWHNNLGDVELDKQKFRELKKN